MPKKTKPSVFFPTGSRVRLPGDTVIGIVMRTTANQAYVDWVGFVYSPSYDGWYPHAKLRSAKR